MRPMAAGPDRHGGIPPMEGTDAGGPGAANHPGHGTEDAGTDADG